MALPPAFHPAAGPLLLKEQLIQIRRDSEAVERLGIAVIDFEADRPERRGIDPAANRQISASAAILPQGTVPMGTARL